MTKTVHITPIDVSEKGRGKVTREQLQQVEEFIQILPAGAPEIWDGLPFTIGEKTWQLVAKVEEEENEKIDAGGSTDSGVQDSSE